MRIIFTIILTVLAACATHPSNAIEGLSDEVLKKDRGISIQIVPIDKKS
jgi:hypothetical protein